MVAKEEQEEDLIDRLLLDVKAISLLYGSELELREKLDEKMMESNDESIRKFVKALQMGGHRQTGRLVAIALGQLLLASLLVVAGAVILVPTVVGVNTLSGLVQFFSERISGNVVGTILTPYLGFIEFAIGVVLVLSAFFSLREAAANLKEAGFAIKSGET